MKKLILALAGLLALLSTPAFAATLTAQPVDFAQVVAKLKPGDTLTLVGKFTGPLRPKGGVVSGVTIRAEGATVDGLFYPAGAVKGLIVVGGTWSGLRVDGVDGLTVSGAVFRGPDPADGYGLQVNGGRNIVVTGASLESYKTGIALNRVEDVRVEGSAFARMRSDGLTIGESRRIVIRSNLFHGTRITGDEHPDAAQIFSRPGSAPTSDVLIEENRVVGMSQGFTGFNHIRNGVDDGGFDRIVIRRNDLWVGYSHAVALVDARDSRIEDNVVRTYPGAPYRASINVTRGSAARCGNAVAPGAGKTGVTEAACR